MGQANNITIIPTSEVREYYAQYLCHNPYIRTDLDGIIAEYLASKLGDAYFSHLVETTQAKYFLFMNFHSMGENMELEWITDFAPYDANNDRFLLPYIELGSFYSELYTIKF